MENVKYNAEGASGRWYSQSPCPCHPAQAVLDPQPLLFIHHIPHHVIRDGFSVSAKRLESTLVRASPHNYKVGSVFPTLEMIKLRSLRVLELVSI